MGGRRRKGSVNPAMTFRSTRFGAQEARPSFAAAAEEHLDAVYRYLLLMTRDDATAQDLTSETFEKALRSWRRFDPRRASARTWLCRIARNAALDHFRGEERRRRREERYGAEPADVGEPRLPGVLSPVLPVAPDPPPAAERPGIAPPALPQLRGAEAPPPAGA